MPLHPILRFYVNCSFEAIQFYEIEDLIFAPYVHHLSSTSDDFPYHSMDLTIHTDCVY